MKQVKEIMKKNLVTAFPDHTISELRMLMSHFNIGAIPIVRKDDGFIVGIITDQDLRLIQDQTLPASDVMSTTLQSITPNSSISAAANLMLQYGIHHLIVKDRGEFVGLISSMDLLTTLGDARSHFAHRMVFI